jgi:hypothetical protein
VNQSAQRGGDGARNVAIVPPADARELGGDPLRERVALLHLQSLSGGDDTV